MAKEQLEMTRRQRQQEQIQVERHKLYEQQQEKKLRIEQALRDICDYLNQMKDNISEIEISLGEDNTGCSEVAESQQQIDSYERELDRLRSDISNLEKTHTQQLVDDSQAVAAAHGFIENNQAHTAQIELVKSFVSYLSGKLTEKRNEMRRREALRVRLGECERNLTSYMELARQFVTDSVCRDDKVVMAMESRGDLIARIEAIESIERSIQECLRQINEIRTSFQQSSNFPVCIRGQVLNISISFMLQRI